MPDVCRNTSVSVAGNARTPEIGASVGIAGGGDPERGGPIPAPTGQNARPCADELARRDPMTADGVVRGWSPYRMAELARQIRDAEDGDGCHIRIYAKGNTVSDTPVLLIPDDGTQVVVGREEWERTREALRDAEQVVPWMRGIVTLAVHSKSIRDLTEADEAARLCLEKIAAVLAPIVTPEEHDHDKD